MTNEDEEQAGGSMYVRKLSRQSAVQHGYSMDSKRAADDQREATRPRVRLAGGGGAPGVRGGDEMRRGGGREGREGWVCGRVEG